MRRTFLRSKDAKALVVARNVLEMRTYRQGVIFKNPRATVGFVPTMGFLHEGHLSLFREARKNNDFVAASIFVNPSQFAAHEDFDVYPSNIERDLQYLKDEGVDVVFMPDSKEMYSGTHATWVVPDSDGNLAEGSSRPGFFRGVATVVTKLFNIVQPTTSYFGQKDAQQAMVIQTMVDDLDMPLRVEVCPTVRESDGLAMSSRNANLCKDGRRIAPVVYRGLREAEKYYAEKRVADSLAGGGGCGGQRTMPRSYLQEIIEDVYQNEGGIEEVHYISIASKHNMEELDHIDLTRGAIISVAVQIGGVRLIDNLLL